MCFVMVRGGTLKAAEPQKRPARSRKTTRKTATKPATVYSNFSHQTHFVTQKLECSSCHKLPTKNWKEVRAGDAAFPDVAEFPEHSACLGCHRQQFFARERPAPSICANCHVAVRPRDTTRWIFPSLGDVNDPKRPRREFASEFRVQFPHDKHIDVVSRLIPPAAHDRAWFVNASLQEQKKETPPASCPVCHSTHQPQGDSSEEYVTKPPADLGDRFWLKKGSFKTIPTSHTICFTCHNADAGLAPEPKDCNACHKLASGGKLPTDFDPKLLAEIGIKDKVIIAAWSRRISAGAFRHEGGAHPDLNCLNCHHASAPEFNPADLKTLKVPAASCGGAEGCHITKTTDDGGAMNFEIDQRKADAKFVCTKCHVTFGKQAVPASHGAAVAAAAAKKD